MFKACSKNKRGFTQPFRQGCISRGQERAGFTLIEILIVTGLIALLFGIAVPSFTNALSNVRKNSCIDNLRQIKLAKEQWALENNKVSTDTPALTDLAPYFKYAGAGEAQDITDANKNIIFCPLAATHAFLSSYTIGNIAANPACQKLPLTHKLD